MCVVLSIEGRVHRQLASEHQLPLPPVPWNGGVGDRDQLDPGSSIHQSSVWTVVSCVKHASLDLQGSCLRPLSVPGPQSWSRELDPKGAGPPSSKHTTYHTTHRQGERYWISSYQVLICCNSVLRWGWGWGWGGSGRGGPADVLWSGPQSSSQI